MKVLFAVNNERISEHIVKKYQKEYKEIISYKNVYYFNAIIKELQKDKTYDRIVISEDLEPFTNTTYDQMDKFIFEKLDNISDEASNSKGNDIPIILICTERRSKSEQILVKLFGIGVYDAIIGQDRSTDEVCRLINKPRTKKEAKIYYKIDAEEVNYEKESENEVSEAELQNILAHFKRIGKNEVKYIESFDNICTQYNDEQLKIIAKYLPLNVRAVLEESSPRYQKLMAFNKRVSDDIRKKNGTGNYSNNGPTGILLNDGDNIAKVTKSVVVPSAMSAKNIKKVATRKQEEEEQEVEEAKEFEIDEIKEEPVVKRRGRPKKIINEEDIKPEENKRKRGRPKKIQEIEDNYILPGFEDEEEDNFEEVKNILQEIPVDKQEKSYKDETFILPGMDDDQEDTVDKNYTYIKPVERDYSDNKMMNNFNDEYEEEGNLDTLLVGNKKIISFVGTSKNGTSFIINNVAEQLSEMGINTAILDTTQNKNSFYIYTKNEEALRKTASNSINNLIDGEAKGIMVNRALTVYTDLPSNDRKIENTNKILETLIKNHTIVLIDCDFNTPIKYFEKSQEIYLVQSMDVLTIQPLTAFLRELKSKNVLDENKIRIIINKYVKMRGVTSKNIIGGMAFYNDPGMSFMTELFDRNIVKYVEIPFEEDIYISYLEGLINCDISIKGYSKNFKQTLKELTNMVYPLLPNKKEKYSPPTSKYANGFSSSTNNTLNNMKRRY